MTQNRIIVHTIIENNNKILVTKRCKEENTFPGYWDIPGGLVEWGELPKQAIIREVKEEVGLDIIPTNIIHEDSNLDKQKNMIFIRLVYLCKVSNNNFDIKLDEKEHEEYRWIFSLNDIKGEKIVPFVKEILKNRL